MVAGFDRFPYPTHFSSNRKDTEPPTIDLRRSRDKSLEIARYSGGVSFRIIAITSLLATHANAVSRRCSLPVVRTCRHVLIVKPFCWRSLTVSGSGVKRVNQTIWNNLAIGNLMSIQPLVQYGLIASPGSNSRSSGERAGSVTIKIARKPLL